MIFFVALSTTVRILSFLFLVKYRLDIKTREISRSAHSRFIALLVNSVKKVLSIWLRHLKSREANQIEERTSC